jgi:hypothetical protein
MCNSYSKSMVERIILILVISVNSNVVSGQNHPQISKIFSYNILIESPFLDLEATIYHQL